MFFLIIIHCIKQKLAKKIRDFFLMFYIFVNMPTIWQHRLIPIPLFLPPHHLKFRFLVTFFQNLCKGSFNRHKFQFLVGYKLKASKPKTNQVLTSVWPNCQSLKYQRCLGHQHQKLKSIEIFKWTTPSYIEPFQKCSYFYISFLLTCRLSRNVLLAFSWHAGFPWLVIIELDW